MGWLGNLLKKIAGEETEDLIFVDNLPFPDLDTRPEILPNEHYVELYVESLRIEKSRSFATKFHGVVYSYVTLARLGDQNSVVPAISKPPRLAELDGNSLGKVITVSKQMMGSVPWRGGSFGLELGLFSVKSGNVLTPLVNFVTKVSETAGISFVGAVKPFVPLITEGMNLLSGQPEDVKLAVGVDTNIELQHPMACAIIATKRGSIDTSRLSVDGEGKLVLDGVPLEKGYCVFSIRATTQKADFGEIPELKEKFADLRTAAMKADEEGAGDALAAFRRTVIFSPDLIQSDGKRLIGLAQELYDTAFPPVPRDGAHFIERGAALEIAMNLSDLPLYEQA